MTKTLLITGATGFTGRYLIDEAIRNNFKITALIRKNSKADYLINSAIETIIIEESILITLEKFKKSNPNVDLIIHNAGLVRGYKKSEIYKTNVDFTKELLEGLVKLKIIPKKLIFTSSLAAQGPSDNKYELIKEMDSPKPITHYGQSKLKAEQILQLYPEIPWIITRPTAIYGPGDKDGLSIYKIIKYGLEFSLSTSDQQISLLFVEDFARAVFCLADSSIQHETLIITDGNNYLSRDYMKEIATQMQKRTIKVKIPKGIAHFVATLAQLNSFIFSKPAILTKDKLKELTAENWGANVEKLRENTKFSANTTLNEGIAITIKWYKEHGWI